MGDRMGFPTPRAPCATCSGSPAAAAVHGRDGAADVHRPGRRARRQAAGAALLKRFTPTTLAQNIVRGQYRAGHVDGQPVPSYKDEPDAPAQSTTETSSP